MSTFFILPGHYSAAKEYKKSRPIGQHFRKKLQSGAEPAHFFELLGSIADWLFTNKNEDAFRIPKLSAAYLQEQGLQENYSY